MGGKPGLAGVGGIKLGSDGGDEKCDGGATDGAKTVWTSDRGDDAISGAAGWADVIVKLC